MENTVEFFLVSSLEKVLPARRPVLLPEKPVISAWRGTKASVQLVYRCGEYSEAKFFSVEAVGGPTEMKVSKVGLVPVEMTSFAGADDDFITKDPALLPDVITPVTEEHIRFFPRQYRSLWLTWNIPEDAASGRYEVKLKIKIPSATMGQDGRVFPVEDPETVELPLTVNVIAQKLPKMSIFHNELFYADCLMTQYGVEAFSEEHWQLLYDYLKSAVVDHQVTCVYTPLFTPAMDTRAFTERPTTQLVDVFINNGEYSFCFDKLRRWLSICNELGAQYVELPPFFTQWGAEYTPKIVAVVDGVEKKIFDWGVPAASPEYRRFMVEMLPKALAVFAEYGFDKDHVAVKISDEPQPGQEEQFAIARAQMDGLLDGYFNVESVGSITYVKQGLVKCPCIPSERVDEFRAAGVKDYIFYYCCVEGDKVPNRFIAMESYRNRVMGVMLYIYDCKGFAQWGFNFWNTSYSIYKIDPFRNDHAEWCFPSGDAYLVYPGDDGKPLTSIRAEVQDEAFYDFRGLKLLESYTGREYVLNMIGEVMGQKDICMSSYPKDPALLLALRERLAEELAKF